MRRLAPFMILPAAIVFLTMTAFAASSTTQKKARALAENVLGAGTVKSLSVSDHGATVLIRWESATYKPENRLETTRELMHTEAELATGSMMGRMAEITRIRFSILLKDQTAASGENLRGRGVAIVFAAAFGGGTYKRPEPKSDTKRTGGTDASKD